MLCLRDGALLYLRVLQIGVQQLIDGKYVIARSVCNHQRGFPLFQMYGDVRFVLSAAIPRLPRRATGTMDGTIVAGIAQNDCDICLVERVDISFEYQSTPLFAGYKTGKAPPSLHKYLAQNARPQKEQSIYI